MKKILELIMKYKYFIIGGIVALMILAGAICVYIFKDEKIEEIDNVDTVSIIDEEKKELKEEPTDESKDESITVDVKGEVNKPGVYKLAIGSRVIDAIEISGGITKKADTSMLNLSKILNDENVIIVANKYSQQTIKYVEKECNCDVCINNVTSNNDGNSTNSKISINKATKEELMNLNGIGESKAIDIINYRNANGLFKSIEDLKQISGIGDKLFEKIKDQITI